ncbi:tetratricopeptide repeat protein [Desulfotruncus arcticus]
MHLLCREYSYICYNKKKYIQARKLQLLLLAAQRHIALFSTIITLPWY